MVLNGEKITLEPLDIDKHAKGYFKVSQDKNIHKYVGNTVPKDLEEIVELLKLYEIHFMNWMIISNDTQELIGIIRLGKPSKDKGLIVSGESQRLHSNYWRKGYMKEAKKLLYNYAFDNLGIDILYADVWEGNTNSIKSLEASGYKLIEVQTDIFNKTGEIKEKYIYLLEKEDYLKKDIR